MITNKELQAKLKKHNPYEIFTLGDIEKIAKEPSPSASTSRISVKTTILISIGLVILFMLAFFFGLFFFLRFLS